VFTNEYLRAHKFLSGITNISFHSIKTTIIADNTAGGEMNNLQLAIVYAKTAAAALGLISSTSHVSPIRQIGLTASNDSPCNEGRQGSGPIRGRNRGRNHGRNRGRNHGRGRPDHGFTQRDRTPTKTWGRNPYHSTQGGRGRGFPGLNQNRSPRGGRGGNIDETLIPRNLFDQLSPTQRSIFLRGMNAYNSHDGGMQHNHNPHDRSIGSVQQNIPPTPPGPPPNINGNIDSPSSVSASSQFGQKSRSTPGGGRSTFMMSRSKTRAAGSQSAELYRAIFAEHGESSPTAIYAMDSRTDTVCAGENFIPLFHHGMECDVSGYSDELGTMKNIPVMTVATAIDDISTHKTQIMIVTFALCFP
jgi:hypothetical protein